MSHPARIEGIPRHVLTAAAMVCESHGAHVSGRALRSLADDVDALQAALHDCESFLIGFEDDATQPEVAALLRRVRALLPADAV